MLVQDAGRLDTGSSGHRMLFSRVDLEGPSKNQAMAAYTSTTTPSRAGRTPLCGTPLALRGPKGGEMGEAVADGR